MKIGYFLIMRERLFVLAPQQEYQGDKSADRENSYGGTYADARLRTRCQASV